MTGRPYEHYGGLPPYEKGSDTSRDAAIAALPFAVKQRERVYAAIAAREIGATCDEIEVDLNLPHQSASARIRELVQEERIYNTGGRRATRSGRAAAVYQNGGPPPRADASLTLFDPS